MRLLIALDGSVLWLLADNAAATKNLRKEAEARGVDPQRLIFAPRAPLDEHLARHRLADLFLDTLPYNAHTTASDALWAGLPVLTCSGKSFASRVAASLLITIGLPDMVTDTPSAYEAKALALARDKARLGDVRRRVAANRLTSPLFDGKLFARHLETAFSAIAERAVAGLPPASFTVEG
jgi:protein O-GlcNAc transferase